jgi:hypothetical protein
MVSFWVMQTERPWALVHRKLSILSLDDKNCQKITIFATELDSARLLSE